MGLTPGFSELQGMTTEQLVQRYDALAPSTMAGTNFYLLEIARRLHAEQTDEMLRMTRTIKRLTWFIGVITLVNVAFFVATVIRTW